VDLERWLTETARAVQDWQAGFRQLRRAWREPGLSGGREQCRWHGDPPANPRSLRKFYSIGQAQGLLASTADGGATWALSKPPAGVGGVTDVPCPSGSSEASGRAPCHMEAAV
jgi:hypothetical protein